MAGNTPNTDPYASLLGGNRGNGNDGNKQNSTVTTSPTTTTTNSNTNSNTNGNSSTSATNMDPSSLAALQQLIAQLTGKGTPEQQAEAARLQQMRLLLQGLLPSASTSQAFTDAKGLMALNLQKAMDANMPAIQRSIAGAGTSASSMQGLLAQTSANDAALAASSLGGDMAKSYQNNQVGMLNILAKLNTPNSTQTNALLAALGLAKGAITNSNTSSSSSTNSSTNTTADTGPTTTTTNYGDFNPSPSSPSIGSVGPSVAGNNTGLSWNEAMAQSRRPDGSMDWNKAAGLL